MKVSLRPHDEPGVYTLDYRPDGAKGRRVREHVHGYEAAIARKEELEGRPAQSTYPRLSEIVGEYLAWCEKNLAESTFYGKKRRLEIYILPQLGQYRVRDLTQRVLDSYCATLPKVTTLIDLRHLKAMISWMVKRRYAEPLTWVPELPTYKPKIKRLPSAEDINRLISALPVERHRIACLMMLLTGLRWNEVRNLRWENYHRGEILLTVTKTGHTEIITIPSPCMEWFETNKDAAGYVFAVNGRATPPAGIGKEISKAVKATGVKMSPHMFRHASATALYELTNDLYAVQHHLRHSKITTTEIYTRYSTLRRKGSIDALTEAFKVDKKEKAAKPHG